MRKLVVLAILLPLTLASVACAQEPAASQPTGELATMTDKVSYAIGLNLGKGLKQQEVEVDLDVLLRGIKDALAEGQPAMTDEEIQQTMLEFQQDLARRAQERRAAQAEKNQAEGETFLAQNKGKEGVQVTESGLQYMVIQEGTGPKPTASDRVQVHYRGTLIDGTQFDSSYDRGQPATFPLSSVIPGWTEGVQLMSVGSKYKFFLPSDLGYGPNGSGPVIGPNATLIFEVELLGIEGQGGDAANGTADQ
jgi:FKBP-type peptidyl-prolyl cis-trans isomerase